ncbi:alpha/beta fold hydrolase [Acidihalobacter prosperus]
MPPIHDERWPAAAGRRPPRDLWLNTGNGRFAARDFGGRGRDVLLVHGTGHNLEVWTPLVECLAGAFRLTAFDLRGHGRTEVDSIDAEQYWRDIGTVISAMGLECPLLVGHSTGAYAVTAYAADGGECAGVVLLDGFVLDVRRTPEEAAAWRLSRQELWNEYRYGWLARSDEMETYVGRTAAAASGGDGPYAGVPYALVEAVARRSFIPAREGYLRRPTLDDLEAVCRNDVSAPIYPAREIYRRLSVPAGFVFASRGNFARRRDEVRAVASEGENRWFAEIDAGHNLHMQEPGKVAELLLDHFGG